MRAKNGKCFGLVAEFNPFHNGHEAFCGKARGAGAGYILAVMSGNFVQRGGFAVTDKLTRTEAALKSGVDLVIELPLPFATATAQRFAAGAVELLKYCGCVDSLCFGSECGDAGSLRTVSRAVEDVAVQAGLRKNLALGMTYAKARQMAVEKVFGNEIASLLSSPNNILAVEYLRQAERLGWDVEAYTAKRLGTSHDSPETSGRYASASWLRNRPLPEWEPYIPSGAFAVYRRAEKEGRLPADGSKMETAVLSYLRRLDKERLAALPDLSEGLEGRLYTAIRSSSSLAALETALKTKRYTMARVRRLILSAFLGITRELAEAAPPYIRVLGFTKRGEELLGEIKRGGIPVHTSLLRLQELGGQCAEFAKLEAMAGDLYALAQPAPYGCGREYSGSAVFV